MPLFPPSSFSFLGCFLWLALGQRTRWLDWDYSLQTYQTLQLVQCTTKLAASSVLLWCGCNVAVCSLLWLALGHRARWLDWDITPFNRTELFRVWALELLMVRRFNTLVNPLF